MAGFKETHEVGFDADGFAVHKTCGNRLIECWNVVRNEDYHLKRDGTIELAGHGGDDKSCYGVWCDYCDTHVSMEKM